MMPSAAVLKCQKKNYTDCKKQMLIFKKKEKNPILCACKEREHQTVKALSIVLNYAGLL